jgi:hypothetical protein
MKNCCAIGALMLMGTSAWGGVVDDFEGYATGGQAGGIWHDTTDFITNPTNPGPTSSVIATTDAFGNATQAVQIDPNGLGTSGGLIGRVGHSPIQHFETDLRLDQQGNGSAPNWIAAAGFVQETVQDDFNWMPQAFIYTTRANHRFRLYVQNQDGQGGASRDFGLGTVLWSFDTWYRLELDVNTETGEFNASVVEIATGDVLVNATRQYAGWNSEMGAYDMISVNDGEMGVNTGTVGNGATIDNLGYTPAPGSVIILSFGGLLASRRKR